jgi:hypothetical protein
MKLEMVQVTRVVSTAVVLRCGKQMEKLPHYHFSWMVSFQKQRYICEMLPLDTKLLQQSDLRRGVFLEEMSCRRYDKKKCKEQKEHHSYKNKTCKDLESRRQNGEFENKNAEE